MKIGINCNVILLCVGLYANILPMQGPTLVTFKDEPFIEFFTAARHELLPISVIQHLLSQPRDMVEQLQALEEFFKNPMLLKNQQLILTIWTRNNGISPKLIKYAESMKRRKATRKFAGNQHIANDEQAAQALFYLQRVKDQIERANSKE